MILHFGGSFFSNNNIQNNNGLEYLTEAVKAKIFNIELYQGIFLKAAYYMYSINASHIFYDGNKRTGLASSLLFLEKNDFKLKNDLDLPSMTAFALRVADGNYELSKIETWYKDNSVRISDYSSNIE